MRGIYLLVLVTAILIAYSASLMLSTRISVNRDPSDSAVNVAPAERLSQEVVGKASDTQKSTEESVINAVDHVDTSSDNLNRTESPSGGSRWEETQTSDSDSKIQSSLPPEEEIGVEEPHGVWGGGERLRLTVTCFRTRPRCCSLSPKFVITNNAESESSDRATRDCVPNKLNELQIPACRNKCCLPSHSVGLTLAEESTPKVCHVTTEPRIRVAQG